MSQGSKPRQSNQKGVTNLGVGGSKHDDDDNHDGFRSFLFRLSVFCFSYLNSLSSCGVVGASQSPYSSSFATTSHSSMTTYALFSCDPT